MGKRIGKNFVQLDDGTMWTLDLTDDDEDGLEWIFRYGSPKAREEQRLVVASIMASFHALVFSKTQRERNAIVSEIKRAIQERPR